MALHRPTHSSQMNMPGPAISIFTWCCDLPQNEQCTVFGSLRPKRRPALRRARASPGDFLGAGLAMAGIRQVEPDCQVNPYIDAVKWRARRDPPARLRTQ